MSATRAAVPPLLDGIVADDPAWRVAAPVKTFEQAAPDEGQSSSEATEVRVIFDNTTLYVGVICFTSDPATIVTTDQRRDASLENTDSFAMVIDTFLDRQNGFVFGTNPAGMEYDGQVANEGRETAGGFGMAGRTQAGSGSGFNLNWDAGWQVRTYVGTFGWSAEFAIPFRSFRYPAPGPQTWGINFARSVRHRKEIAHWSPVPRQFKLQNVSYAGTVEGLDVPAQRNFKLVPYVLREVLSDVNDQEGAHFRSQGGVDIKYSFTPSLTADVTLGTDFSQIEVDEQQTNLTRFPVLFPEKRPFFLENAGSFTAGHPGQVDLFFSRRIGIGPGGQVIPIVGGARLSGKAGGFRLGVLDMQAEAVQGVTPANNFGVARLARELPNRSSVGVLFVNRQATSGADASRNRNQTYAVDGRAGIGRYGLVSGFLAKTQTPGRDGRDHAFEVAGAYDAPHWVIDGRVTQVTEDFNPEVGFLQRTNTISPEGGVMYRHRPENFLGFYELRPHARFYSFRRPDGFEESRFVHLDNHWEWRNGYELRTGVNLRRESLTGPFEIHPGVIIPMGTYDHVETQLMLKTNRAAPLSFEMEVIAGGFYDGRRLSARPRLAARFGSNASADIFWDRNQVSLPGGDFVANLAVARLSYSFSNRMFVQGLAQYAGRAGIFASNLRFGWLQSGGTGFFIVYNETTNTGAGFAQVSTLQRSIVAKLSLVVDVL